MLQVFSPSITLLETTMEDSHTPLKDPSSGPAKFQIGASDDEFDEPEVEIVLVSVLDRRGHPPPIVRGSRSYFLLLAKLCPLSVISKVISNASTAITGMALRPSLS